MGFFFMSLFSAFHSSHKACMSPSASLSTTALNAAPRSSPPLLHWHNLADTQAFAKATAQALRQASRSEHPLQRRSAVIALRGDLGAGKTTFTRHLLQSLGVQGRIKSPTYALVESYEVDFADEGERSAAAGDFSIWHFDFYRLQHAQEYLEAGFADLMASPGLKLIEWPERAQALLPVADWTLTLNAPVITPAQVHEQDDASTLRTVQIDSATPTGLAWWAALQSQSLPAWAAPKACA
jgi:tRNA threonylcarbamoyladenosine biosynthesis protein TsaE